MVNVRSDSTDPKLLERLKKSALRKMSEEEREEQMISFIYAGLPKDMPMSKAEISKALKRA